MTTRPDTGGRLPLVTLLLQIAAWILLVFSGAQAADPSNGRIVAMYPDLHGKLVVASTDSLVRIDTVSREHAPMGLPPPVSRVSAFAASADGTLYLAGPGWGVWRSEDGGDTWAAGNDGLPGGEVAALAVHADQERTVYAYVAADGIYRSEDAGRSWQLMDAGAEGMTGPLIHTDMPGSMQTGWLFVATRQGVSRSMDCFCLWRDAGALGTEVHALTHDPDRPERIFAATDAGILRSDGGGEEWVPAGAPLSAIRALSHAPGGVLYAGAATGEVFVSTDAAKTWRRLHGVGR